MHTELDRCGANGYGIGVRGAPYGTMSAWRSAEHAIGSMRQMPLTLFRAGSGARPKGLIGSWLAGRAG